MLSHPHHTQDFHPWDGQRLLSSGMDNMVKVWSLSDHLPIVRLSASWDQPAKSFPTGTVQTPAFSSSQVSDATPLPHRDGPNPGLLVVASE